LDNLLGFIKSIQSRPGGLALWTSHLPQEFKKPGSNPARVFKENIAMQLCVIDLKGIVCVFT
jgi:hypothetical protein